MPITIEMKLDTEETGRRIADDMRAAGDAIPAHRIGPARTIDAAPTVSAWLGMPPPRDARGTSLLNKMLAPARTSDRSTQ